MQNGPLIVQSDHTILLEVAHPEADTAKHELAIFAELERAPEHFHTYRLTKLGLWNARAAGHTAADVLKTLNTYAKFALPTNVATEVEDTMARYGKLRIERQAIADGDELILTAKDAHVLREVRGIKAVQSLLTEQIDDHSYKIAPWARGELKQLLLKRGWPAEDLAGFTPGTPKEIELNQDGWALRDYQEQAIERFIDGGSGVVVLPCGAGKTIVGAGAMARVKAHTLILVTGNISAKQWREELLGRTTLQPEDIGEYTGTTKEIKPITIATYQILSSKRQGKFAHLSLLSDHDWGLILYDEVHLLPAPIFKLTAELQARRRLGLTATLVREDGKESDVFSLIGPKRFDAPWKELEEQGFIAPAECIEIRVEMTEAEKLDYSYAEDVDRYRISASSSSKDEVIKKLIAKHPDEAILVIGQYIDQLEKTAEFLNAPLITGKTPTSDREDLFAEFRAGQHPVLVVSKVANFSIDLPDASVAIQISGSFGSRQEEAQRLGRILRPNKDGATSTFYSLVSQDTVDQDFALNRQRFLAEQGYSYTILKATEL